MAFLYDLIFLFIAAVYLPIYALKRKFHKGFAQRFGNVEVDLKGRPIWIHAVSVGEMKSCEQLIAGLRRLYPHTPLAISTVTATGNKIARSIAKEGDLVFYLPLDFSFIVRRLVNRLNPALFIITETEIWPNLISFLYQRNTPIVTVNARISDKSFKGYRLIRGLISPVLRKIKFFCVQSEADSRRLSLLGVDQDKIRITGNMKYDYTDYGKGDYSRCRAKLALGAKERLFVAASTHPGEEEAVLKVYKELLGKFSDLNLLIAPRHPERSMQVAESIKSSGFEPVLISGLDADNANNASTQDARRIFILDTIGQLIPFYAISDIVFIGGSLVKKGGHNILEPAFFGKPVLTGPYMFNFKDIINTFAKAKAVITVGNPGELRDKIAFLLNNKEEAAFLGQRSKKIFAQNQGASRSNLECVGAIFKEDI